MGDPFAAGPPWQPFIPDQLMAQLQAVKKGEELPKPEERKHLGRNGQAFAHPTGRIFLPLFQFLDILGAMLN